MYAVKSSELFWGGVIYLEKGEFNKALPWYCTSKLVIREIGIPGGGDGGTFQMDQKLLVWKVAKDMSKVSSSSGWKKQVNY